MCRSCHRRSSEVPDVPSRPVVGVGLVDAAGEASCSVCPAQDVTAVGVAPGQPGGVDDALRMQLAELPAHCRPAIPPLSPARTSRGWRPPSLGR